MAAKVREHLPGTVMHPTTFDYLMPTPTQKDRMARVRVAAKVFCDVLQAELPDGADKTITIRAHRSNAMWANVAITRNVDGSPRTDDETGPGIG